MTFRDVIKKRRLELNMTPTDVAYKSRLSVSYISHLENGIKPSPSPEKAFILAEALKLPPQELVWLSVREKLPESMKSKLSSTLLPSKKSKISVEEAIDADKELSDYSKKTLREMYLMLHSTDTRQRQMMIEKDKGINS